MCLISVTCGGPNCGERCLETISEEEAKYMGHAPYSNNYNSGWKNHPNLSWGDRWNNYEKPCNNNQGFQGQGARSQEQNSGKKSVKEMLGDFLAQQEDANKKR